MPSDIPFAFRHWFRRPGAHVMVDGQFGSTGKGLLAGAMAEEFWGDVEVVTTNAGPNSGHTCYFDDEKIVLNQLPTFSVVADKAANKANAPNNLITYINAGALVNLDLLMAEKNKYGIPLRIDPCAARIDSEVIRQDKATEMAVASTGTGNGPALMRKIARLSESAVLGPKEMQWPFVDRPDFNHSVTFIEVSQGFSLGINSGFYPHVTSRECTVSQALADAGIPPNAHQKTVMCVRAFPIRTGNTENSSGPGYPDQFELEWANIGVEPELSTTTKRVRRIFSWSDRQYVQSLIANAPDIIFLNFAQYLQTAGISLDQFINRRVLNPYISIMGRAPEALLLGFGPKSSDIKLWNKATL